MNQVNQAPTLTPTTSAVLRTWSVWRWVGVFGAAAAVAMALSYHPATRLPILAVVARLQWDNAPLTLGLVLLSLIIEGMKHYFFGVADALEATSLFVSPSLSEVNTLFDGRVYVQKWRLPDYRLLRLVLFSVRIFLCNVGHSGWSHFSGNATQLLLLGPACEGAFGSRSILLMAASMSVASVVTQWTFGGRSICSQGASGVVFMFYLLSAQINREAGKVPVTLLLQMAVYLPKELEPILNPVAGDTVSHLGHCVGAVIGAAFGFVHTAATLEPPPPPTTPHSCSRP